MAADLTTREGVQYNDGGGEPRPDDSVAVIHEVGKALEWYTPDMANLCPLYSMIWNVCAFDDISDLLESAPVSDSWDVDRHYGLIIKHWNATKVRRALKQCGDNPKCLKEGNEDG